MWQQLQECSRLGLATSSYLAADNQLMVATVEAHKWTALQEQHSLQDLSMATRVRKGKLLQQLFAASNFKQQQTDGLSFIVHKLKNGLDGTRAQRMMDKETEKVKERAEKLTLLLLDMDIISMTCQHPAIEDDCPICMDAFAVGQQVCVLACDHLFHECCMKRWLHHSTFTCPLCRATIEDIFSNQ